MNTHLFRKTGKYVVSFFFGLSGLFASAQTELIVKLNDASEQNYSISENGRIYFEDENLMIDEGGQLPTGIAIASIRNITFAKNTTSIPQVNKDDSYIYPNPARDIINIVTSSDTEISIIIYDLNGRKVLQRNVFSGEQIDVTQLPAGFYLLKMNNKTIKFTKL